MGGRGTFAAGNPVPYSYQTIGAIEGIKVLQGISGKHGLPEEASSSTAYIVLNHDKSVRQIRLYNTDRTAKTDIEYSKHQGRLILHAHDYIRGVRQNARELSIDEKKNYIRYFGGNHDE